ncbi:helix-turn-helix domain-containing protein [Actinoalloteichus hymeniacidonis]|nr:helix-turn-helix transcriptional regulator [Actinoalloteichus hymeniacidonis]MBB5906191.1 transcriptional regulator with XRE-family HTH domain [Actinoalloteichus hymeniacidonis]
MTWMARSRILGDELRRHRNSCGLTLAELGARTGRGKSTIARWETGEKPIDRDDLLKILGALGITGPTESALLSLVGDLSQKSWYDEADMPKRLRDLAALESKATKITELAIAVVPGLIQTSAYAAAVLRGMGGPEDRILHRVENRIARQTVLAGSVQYTALLDELVLQRPVGGAEVMRAQLDQLATLSQQGNVTLRVLPVGLTHPGLTGAFILLEFAHGLPIVHIEQQRTSALLDRKAETAAYQATTSTLRAMAMDAEASRALIHQYADRWRDRAHGEHF